ncbi:hypothetical protein SAMN02746065_12911 [Desulfocicer vacuolatum DSM 3385]|uniref:Uncharacterized protein n=1 Tax=Desulfocicer vacuolatum DSM 3385 TaxID=1121400 RepID=A0A1W2ED65_9BACT|nr:hypothetical protein [Desulfocicer vacuolatum]SMD07597.1 hypothetical protein SAMN02746065_12911 [Desulfocicer vacuolatum DSM 3385]
MGKNPMKKKVNKWIKKGKDPRSAHWQAALEATLKLFGPDLEPGRLIPMGPLEDEDLVVFEKALAVVDLSPNVSAAFIPPLLAGKLTPPDTVEELHRISKDAPSYQILISRPGKEIRILSAEISEHATRPGVDLFQSGAFLGNYDFENQSVCLEHLNKIIRAHVWKAEGWTREDHVAYTLNWFEKVTCLNSATVAVEKDFSFFHSPTLIKSNQIDAMFTLMTEDLLKRGKDETDPFGQAVLSMENLKQEGREAPLAAQIIEDGMLQQLNLMRTLDLVKFSDFTNAQSEKFKRGFSETVRYLEGQLA